MSNLKVTSDDIDRALQSTSKNIGEDFKQAADAIKPDKVKPTEKLYDVPSKILEGVNQLTNLVNQDKAQGILAQERASLEKTLIEVQELPVDEQLARLKEVSSEAENFNSKISFLEADSRNRISQSYTQFASGKINAFSRNIVRNLAKKRQDVRDDAVDTYQNLIRSQGLEGKDASLQEVKAGAASALDNPDELEQFSENIKKAEKVGYAQYLVGRGELTILEDFLEEKETKKTMEPVQYNTFKTILENKKEAKRSYADFGRSLMESVVTKDFSTTVSEAAQTGDKKAVDLTSSLRATIMSNSGQKLNMKQKMKLMDITKDNPKLANLARKAIKQLSDNISRDPVQSLFDTTPEASQWSGHEIYSKTGSLISNLEGMDIGQRILSSAKEGPQSMAMLRNELISNNRFGKEYTDRVIDQSLHILSQLDKYKDKKGAAQLRGVKALFSNNRVSTVTPPQFLNALEETGGVIRDNEYEPVIHSQHRSSVANPDELLFVWQTIAEKAARKLVHDEDDPQELKRKRYEEYVKTIDSLAKDFYSQLSDPSDTWFRFSNDVQRGGGSLQLTDAELYYNANSRQNFIDFIDTVDSGFLFQNLRYFDDASKTAILQKHKIEAERDASGDAFRFYIGGKMLKGLDGAPFKIAIGDVIENGKNAWKSTFDNSPISVKARSLHPQSIERKMINYLDINKIPQTLEKELSSHDIKNTEEKNALLFVTYNKMHTESKFGTLSKKKLVSSANALGLMQVVPRKDMDSKKLLNDPKYNLSQGIDIYFNAHNNSKNIANSLIKSQPSYKNKIKMGHLFILTELQYNAGTSWNEEILQKIVDGRPLTSKQTESIIYVRQNLGLNDNMLGIASSAMHKPPHMTDKEWAKWSDEEEGRLKIYSDRLLKIHSILGTDIEDAKKYLNKKYYK